MHEQAKITEAEYFYGLMIASEEHFSHHLSAFLSSARSCLQYALAEAQQKRAQPWYEGQVSQSAVVQFLRDKRTSISIAIPSAPTRGSGFPSGR
jgi:hypothetical protein